MKWKEDAKQGIVVAGGQDQGTGLGQLSYPYGVVVDQSGTVYVIDQENDRIMHWSEVAAQESVVIGGNGKGSELNQFNCPWDLSFDRHGNLYVVDKYNYRVQKFNIYSNS
ncbi:unnamed protein product [Rotaria sp. Silwood1]|nr:unnamed protein product [Rotaria sp. Silwood1]CAF4657339.1 unnamed protein product [Rotaria sp. Silwood1]